MTNVETNAEAWRRRTAQGGPVDFTMMYVAHDAFTRDLSRVIAASRDGRLSTPEARATWAEFCTQLHTHHRTEDTSLWPRVRAAVGDATELDVLEQMEAEHDALDPVLEQVGEAFERGTTAHLTADLQRLADVLAVHMRHEEDLALPLVAKRIGSRGWAAFGKDIRDAQGGIRAGRTYLPWVLDGAPGPARRATLRVLPPPLRIVYSRVWEPAYRRTARLR